MNTKRLQTVEQTLLKTDVPPVNVGDTIAVKTIIREGDKKRFQTFKGIVIAIKGSGIRKTITVRKISFGVGVEKILPLHSPNIESIELIKKGDVRRAKLYYLRDRVGKKATKVKQGDMTKEEIAYYEEMEKKEEEERKAAEAEAKRIEEEKQAEEKAKAEAEKKAAEESKEEKSKSEESSDESPEANEEK